MQIKSNHSNYPLDFGVSVQFDITSGFSERVAEQINLMIKGTLVELNREECKELIKVLKGEDCHTIIVKEESVYEPHTMFFHTKSKEETANCVEFEGTRKQWSK